MPQVSKTASALKQELLREAAKMRSEILLPGYWDNLAANCLSWANELTAAPFWKDVEKNLNLWRGEFRTTTGADLLASASLPSFSSKTKDSIQDRFCRNWRRQSDYRANALPSSGPPIPNLGDLVRTRLTCPYIDGVEFLANKIESFAKDLGIFLSRTRQGSLQGYFAQHIGIKQSVFFRLGGEANPAEIECEIQIATILATRMWDASHPVYEIARQGQSESHEWQWQPNDPRFISNQLGHMLHLADGLLVQLRESLRKQGK